MRKTFLIILCIVGGLSSNAQFYFSATAPCGHTLYYDTINNGGERQAKVIRRYLSDYNSYNGNLIIPDSVNYNGLNIPVVAINSYAFENCNSLESVVIGNRVNTIGESAFENCQSMTSVVIGNNVSYIGSAAFRYCSSLTSVSIPNSVDTIRDYTFYFCNNLETAIVGDGVRYIGQGAFVSTSLSTIDIGSGITTIVSGSIGGENLSNVYIRSALAPTLLSTQHYDYWGESAICNYINCFFMIHIPCASLYSYQYSYPWYYYYNNSRIIPIPTYSYEFLSNDTTMGTVEISYITCTNNIGVSAVANPGFEFVRWSDGYPNSGREVYLNRDTSITAFFDTISYAIVGWSNNNTHGTVSGSDTVYVGHTVTLTATPNYGYHFWQWDDGNTENPRTVVATSDRIYIAYFEVGSDHFYISAVSSDTTRGIVSGSGSYDYLAECTISATPNYGYHFSMWSDGDTNNPRVFTLTQDTTFAALFEINDYQLTVLPNDSTLGCVFGSGTYPYGTQVTVAVSPLQDNRFDHRSNNSTLPIHSFSLTSDLQLVAIFLPADTIFVHDTTMVFDTVTLTEYVSVHDTTYIDVFVHDTTMVVDTVTITEYVSVHDTTIVSVHDTTYINIHDTTYITQTDTVTNTVYDTITNTVFDTITNTVFDTITNTIHDTTVVYSTDTLWLHDTVFVHDIIYIHDTIVIGVDEVDVINAKIYTSNGQIVVESGDGMPLGEVQVFDMMGRHTPSPLRGTPPNLGGEQRRYQFDVPASGAYLVKIGNHPARKVVVIR